MPLRTSLHAAVSLLCIAPLTLIAQRVTPVRGAAGEWVFQMVGDQQPQRVVLTADGDSLRGNVYGQAFSATLNGARLTFNVGDFRWRGTLQGDSIRGWLGLKDSSAWLARRFRPPATARSYDVTPTSWPREFATNVAPVLRLHPGDTVRTSTVDAGGNARGAFESRENHVTRGGNPLTGPFYVEGAVPGDVLIVRLLKVRLNRDWAFSGTQLIDNAIDAGYLAARKPENLDNKWVLDTIVGFARLRSPSAALAALRIPLRPFMGVLAVAPGDGVVPSSRESGAYGGNMEYSQLREGTTLRLPVTELGAYLYLGDGHAAQGDGELTGDAMETSMDVTFSVDIARGVFAGLPRAETADHIMSIGVGGSLEQATRRATTDLAQWLEKDYKLSSSEAALVMGFSVIYDVPDLVGGQVGVSARIPKSVLAPLKR
ncbi:MAG: acetamidase/formamidase family protein [Gemmatimonadaceae bacterium]|nr:acetamidase/formamidase family protein [Gemmatimonadaceae bacterium]